MTLKQRFQNFKSIFTGNPRNAYIGTVPQQVTSRGEDPAPTSQKEKALADVRGRIDKVYGKASRGDRQALADLKIFEMTEHAISNDVSESEFQAALEADKKGWNVRLVAGGFFIVDPATLPKPNADAIGGIGPAPQLQDEARAVGVSVNEAQLDAWDRLYGKKEDKK